MRYRVHHPDAPGHPKTPSTVVTNDGIVVWATPALDYWVGANFMLMMDGYSRRHRGARWELVGAEISVPTVEQLNQWH